MFLSLNLSAPDGAECDDRLTDQSKRHAAKFQEKEGVTDTRSWVSDVLAHFNFQWKKPFPTVRGFNPKPFHYPGLWNKPANKNLNCIEFFRIKDK